MQRRTLLRHAAAGALSLGVVNGVTGTALAGGFDVSFHVDDREVGEDDESADVDCGTPTTVEGRIVGDESCLTAELVDYGREDGDLQFRIETVEDAGDCTDHHVAIEYTIRASDLDDPPAGVWVFHDGDRVARVDCTDDGDGHDDDTDEDDERPEFEFEDDDEHLEFGFEDGEQPEFDFGNEADELPDFEFGNEADEGPEFDFGNEADELPDFEFGNEADGGPEFSFPE
ncbi:hypothetical protein ACOZ4N_11035 [Halorientalis pallida]|uniref:hypothetical protein n=1 Tax=Halorientalis pallida TaxID=2479928 RepID=UPI003C705006